MLQQYVKNRMQTKKVAVVTGANKGIGYAITKGLCEKFKGIVYLTARDVTRGEAAVNKLKEIGLNPTFYQLDINDQNSIDAFKNYIKTTHGGIDLLVNNAAIAYPNASTVPFGQQAEDTISVNYFSLKRICDSIFDILYQNARVVNLSSSAGHLSRIPSADLRAKFSDPNLTPSQLDDLMNKFVNDAKQNKNVENGWGGSAYVVSKVGMTALTKIYQRMFDTQQPERNISVNAVHPGYVDTDMTSHQGPLTIEQGARAPLFLALEDHNLKGAYVWCDSTVVDWFADKTPSVV